MAKLTYLGEGIHPPPSIEWGGVAFPLGEAVEVDDPAMVKKASANPSFKVELEKAPPAPDPESGPHHSDDDDDDAPPHRAAFRRHAPAHAPSRKR